MNDKWLTIITINIVTQGNALKICQRDINVPKTNSFRTNHIQYCNFLLKVAQLNNYDMSHPI